MLGFLQLSLVLVGLISSLICGYFVSKSLYKHFVPSTAALVLESESSVNGEITVNFWKQDPDDSFKQLHRLPECGSYRPGYYFGMKSTVSR